MTDSKLWVQSSKCCQQLIFVDEMNELQSHVLKPLDSMNNSGLWMTWMNLGREIKAQDGYEKLKAMVDMNELRLWAQGSKFYK